MDNAPLQDNSLKGLLAPALLARGYELLQVKLTPGGRYQTLHLMTDRCDGKAMTVQDCVAISHMATVQLEEQGLASDNYTLEVTAPELDRPLVRIEDYERLAGHMAVVDLQAPQEGRQRFMGKIMRVTGREANAELELKTAKGPVRVPVGRIAEARLSNPPETKTAAEGETESA